MTAVKPFAALSSGLLARKGAARPAMRPQGFATGPGGAPASLDDLGWNDMGVAEAPPPPPVAAVPQPATERPPVLVEREELARRIEVPAPTRTVSPATAARLRRETTHTGKSAFTLRLDAERHLRLRLAGAVVDRSAQSLVTLALDALLDSMPVVEALVAQLPPPAPTKRRRS